MLETDAEVGQTEQYRSLGGPTRKASRVPLLVALIVIGALGVTSIVLGVKLSQQSSNPDQSNKPGPVPVALCPVGQYSNYVSCMDCPAGSYQNQKNQTTCNSCTPGYDCSDTGMTKPQRCRKGYFATGGAVECAQCPKGWISADTGATACVICAQGKTAPEGSSDCATCPAGFVQPGYGQSFCIECPAGLYAVNSLECARCPVGRFTSVGAQSQCTACPKGKFAASEGASGCQPCDYGSYQATEGQGSCIKCQAGTVQAQQGQSSCDICNPGRYTAFEGLTACSQCLAGSFAQNASATTCLQCAIGFYQDSSAATSCNPCVPGSYGRSSGSSRCDQCAGGTYTDQPGQYYCQGCASGKYNNLSYGTSTCLLCYNGTYSSYAASECTSCPQGRYSNGPGHSSCDGCSVGYRGVSWGMSYCDVCNPGTYTQYEAQQYCTQCTAGKFATGYGASTCLDCPLKTYFPNNSATACLGCESADHTGMSFCPTPSTGLPSQLSQRILSFMDTSVDPCDDFDQYVCGGWKKTFVLPPDLEFWVGSFSDVLQRTTMQLLDIARNSRFPLLSSTFARCVADLSSGVPRDANFAWFVKNWMPVLKTADQGASAFFNVLGQSMRHNLLNSFVGSFSFSPANGVWGVTMARDNLEPRADSTPYAAVLGVLVQAGILAPLDNVTDAGVQVWNLEQLLPNADKTCLDSVDLSRDEFSNFAGLPFGGFLTGYSDGSVTGSTMGVLDGLQRLTLVGGNCIADSAPVILQILSNAHPTIKPQAAMHHLMIRAIATNIDNLPQPYADAWNPGPRSERRLRRQQARNEYRKRQGPDGSGIIAQTEPILETMNDVFDLLELEQQKYEQMMRANPTPNPDPPTPFETVCAKTLKQVAPDLVSHAWILTAFPEANRQAAGPLVQVLYDKMRTRLNDVTWLDSETRAEALKKLDFMTRNIAYNTDWQTFAPGAPSNNLFMADFASLTGYRNGETAKRFSQPIDRNWIPNRDYTAPNAFYFSEANSINMFAGLMVEPFFSSIYPPMLNLASYGWVIGHEISHGFDPDGSRYNGTGYEVNWWTDASKQAFQNRLQCLIDQYSTFPVLDLFVNGNKTLGENTADLGGLSVAWAAYKDMAVFPDLLPGYSNDKLFWIWAGQVWCQNSTDAYARQQIALDEHSPGRYRILGSMSNLKEFADTWQCSPSSFMGRSKTPAQCQVWNL